MGGVERSASRTAADLQKTAENNGVTMPAMIKEANTAGGPDVPAVNVGPRSKTRRARRSKSRRNKPSGEGEDSPVRRRRSKRRAKAETSGNEIAQQLQDSAITI